MNRCILFHRFQGFVGEYYGYHALLAGVNNFRNGTEDIWACCGGRDVVHIRLSGIGFGSIDGMERYMRIERESSKAIVENVACYVSVNP